MYSETDLDSAVAAGAISADAAEALRAPAANQRSAPPADDLARDSGGGELERSVQIPLPAGERRSVLQFFKQRLRRQP